MLHRYLVRLENSKSYSPKDTVALLIKMRKASDEFGSVVKNLRVTRKALEFDLYVQDSLRKDETTARLEAEFGQKLGERDLQEERSEKGKTPPPPSSDEKESVVRESVELFNEERFWECHETLEQIWRRAPKGPEKDVQQGIILAASAFVHHQRDEDDVCLSMIPRALAKLDASTAGTYYSVDVGRLKSELKNIEVTKKIRLFKI